ncbi:Hypothetical predicted protein [Prunus dulcis]|uniref:Uncharacterized protein n=1 Tax=Prunus dulcis TaxID=3755 RepID=A0A5E4FCJ3_PRUDU|nr:Hypothetical predicted protein [Prunus dulcis]
MRKPNTKCIILISFPSFSQQPSKRRISVEQNLKKARVPVRVKSKSTESKARARFFCAWPGSRAKNRRSNRISKSELRSPLKSPKRRAATPSLESKRRRSNGSEKYEEAEGFIGRLRLRFYTSSLGGFGVLGIGPSTWPSRLRQRHCVPLSCASTRLRSNRCDRPAQEFLQNDVKKWKFELSLNRKLENNHFQRKPDIMMILRIKAYEKDVATGFWNNYGVAIVLLKTEEATANPRK